MPRMDPRDSAEGLDNLDALAGRGKARGKGKGLTRIPPGRALGLRKGVKEVDARFLVGHGPEIGTIIFLTEDDEIDGEEVTPGMYQRTENGWEWRGDLPEAP